MVKYISRLLIKITIIYTLFLQCEDHVIHQQRQCLLFSILSTHYTLLTGQQHFTINQLCEFIDSIIRNFLYRLIFDFELLMRL
jgi:hypothetical protein